MKTQTDATALVPWQLSYLYMAPQLFWGMFLRGANAILSIKHKPHGAMPSGIRNHLRPIDDSEVML